ncbi:MAG: polysaccharide pyruvyl transferase family protein [Verrucomicrobiia bacterium]|jgi:polysaccharide pyruvyl transferase WcaK-like protein
MNDPLNTQSRRHFLQLIALTAATARGVAAKSNRPPRILLRSSWQTINIGDIAHTPGVLRLLENHIPEAEIYLWPSRVDNGVDQLLLRRFPKLKIVSGNKALAQAFTECDFLLHGSGAEFVAERHVVQWLNSPKSKGKPFGVYGITFPPKRSWKTAPVPEENISKSVAVLNQARFVYFRDSESMRFARSKGCRAPVMAYGPDGAFACDVRDDPKAKRFLKASELQTGKFLCCIPRMRYTPGWTIPGSKYSLDPIKHARNEEMKEHDHAPLRDAIIRVTRQTDLKVLLCPEDMTQMQISKDMLLDPLPADVKKRVVWRNNYWLTDEALSVYRRSAGLFGNELHSAIMCIGNGIPAIICRWAEQTSKGTMWRDIGLNDWLFDLDDEAQLKRVAPTVLAMAQNPAEAKAKAARARETVRKHQLATMQQLKRELT